MHNSPEPAEMLYVHAGRYSDAMHSCSESITAALVSHAQPAMSTALQNAHDLSYVL